MSGMASQITSLTICLLNCLFRRRSKKTSKLRVTGFCEGNSPVTGEFPTQRASDAENVSIWWRHHVTHLPQDKMATYFPDYIFKCILMNKKSCKLIRISLKFVPKGPIDYKPALVQLMT